MTKELQLKLLNLDHEVYSIKISIGPFVDSFADIYQMEDDSIVFSSEVYSDYPLDEVSPRDVAVYEVVEDWKESELSYEQT